MTCSSSELRRQILGKQQLELRSDLPGLRFLLIDLRNHGNTARRAARDSFRAPHTVEACARDVIELLASILRQEGQTQPIKALLGHSYGGKVALEVGRLLEEAPAEEQQQEEAERRVQTAQQQLLHELYSCLKQIWILDITPGMDMRDKKNDEVVQVLQTITSLPPVLPSRKWVIEQIKAKGMVILFTAVQR